MVALGAVGALALMLYVGHRNPSRLLLVLFAAWILAPFLGMAWILRASKQWPPLGGAISLVATIALTLATLTAYGAVAFGAAGVKTALPLLVPPATWLFLALAVALAELATGGLWPTPRARKLSRGFVLLTLAGVLAAGLLLLWLRWDRVRETSLPALTGSFATGRTSDVWRDETTDPTAPNPGTRRELVIWIWYPAAASGPRAAPVDYLPAPWREAMDRGGSPIWGLLTRDSARVRAHSLRDAEVSPARSTYPVVLFRGGASAEVLSYSTLAEDLASHGYVVVGVDAPYRTGVVVFPDGRVVTRTPANDPELYSGQDFRRVAERLLAAWTADLAFVLDGLEQANAEASGRFAGRLDLSRVGVFGHSFGGAQAVQFCRQDPRCKAAIDIDGAPLGSVIEAGLRQPFLFVLSDHANPSSSPEDRRVWSDVRSVCDHSPPDARRILEIRGANHFTFSDDGALLKSPLLRGVMRRFGALGISGRRQLAVTTHCVHAFFDAYLQGNGTVPPELLSPLYPELRVLD